MKRFWILSTLAIVAATATLLARTSDDISLNAVEQPVATPQGEMPDNNNEFACNLFRTINEQKKVDGSFLVSPVSVSYLLGMLNEGAGDETRQQITDVLGLDGSAEEINGFFKKMLDHAPRVDTTVTIKTANCILYKSGNTIIPKYKADMQNYYGARIEAIGSDPGNIVHNINNWCKTHTNGMIPELLKKEEINNMAVMFLLNAVYFKANWTNEFDPEKTRDEDFTQQDGTIVKHKMMHRVAKASYGENDLCQTLCLPYGNTCYRMYVQLPKNGKTVDDIIGNLTAKGLKQQLNGMRSHQVDILLPRFTTESATNLKGVLSAMGMPRAFNEIDAEFPNMAQGHKNDLYVSMMKQKAKIEVNEKGTKAAAVTIGQVSRKSVAISQEQIYTFHATHPFVYYIVESNTGSIYFMGTYHGEEGTKVSESNVVHKGEADADKPSDIIYRAVEQMPRFPEGEAALMKYLYNHLQYPPEAAKKKIQGNVILQFVVDKTGQVGEVKVVRPVDKDLDREAIRLVKSLPRFTPGRHNGEAVAVWYTLPVPFKLEN